MLLLLQHTSGKAGIMHPKTLPWIPELEYSWNDGQAVRNVVFEINAQKRMCVQCTAGYGARTSEISQKSKALLSIVQQSRDVYTRGHMALHSRRSGRGLAAGNLTGL